MKIPALACALVLIASATFAQTSDHVVRGYTRADGTYVAPHMQTNPNGTTSDNYSTRGNTNPYTGLPGTKPDIRPADTQPTYGAPRPAPNPYGAAPAKPCTSIYGC